MFWSLAYAQSAVGTAAAKPGLLETLAPMAAMLFIAYIFLLRPNQKKMGDHQKFLTNMKRGDQVITNGGIFGEVMGVTEKFITLQVAENVRIKVLKSQVVGLAKEGAL